MGKKRSTFRNIVEVALSNTATVAAGIIIGFIIPKVLTIDGYGFFKTFTLYTTYTGMFSVGIIDGIVLDYGGKDYSDYNRPFFRSVFRWYTLIHVFWILVLLIICSFVGDNNYRYIILMISIYMFCGNVIGYFQQISQITQRFKEYSLAKVIQSGMKIIGGLIMIAIYYITKELVDYKVYIALTTFGLFVVANGYVYIYKDIIFGPTIPILQVRKQLVHFSKIGFPLMFANLCATLILTLDRQFVNLLFTNKEYAIYAFAYNLLSLITVATSAVSTVLYPILKRTTPDTLKKNYSDLISIIMTFVFGALVSYFPLCFFIKWFLPKYESSLIIFRVIFPGLAISSAVTVVMHNYYKTLGDNLKYFRKSILTLLISAAANAIAYVLFKTTVSISVASIITMIIWYLYIEQYFVKNYHYNRYNNLIYLLTMMATFYVITCISNWFVAGIIYFIAYAFITYFCQKNILLFAKSHLKKE